MGAGSASPIALSAGIVAYNDEPRLAEAVRSLWTQSLPERASWVDLCLVVSPGDDRTVDIAQNLAQKDGRIRLIVERERRGKAAAIAEVLARARGEFLVLMNGDARAQPGAVAALLREVPATPGPFGIMGRPVPETGGLGLLDRSISLLWDVHHAFHVEILTTGRGAHLSDELLLLPTDHLPPIVPGIINDGAFIANWLSACGGSLHYAPGARVDINVPSSVRDYILQRRRIHNGHRQVTRLTGSAPATLQRWVARHPRDVLRIVRQQVRARPGGRVTLAALTAIEGLAGSLSAWDALVGREEPSRWTRIRGRPWAATSATKVDDAGG